MLIKDAFEVPSPVDKVWEFLGDIPQVAACLPGTELTQDLGDGKYLGTVTIRMGPVRMEFAGTATVAERNDGAKRMVIDASGADAKGRGQATMALTAQLIPAPRGTRAEMVMDLQLSGAAAQYGRGMVNDVTVILMHDFAANMQQRLAAADRGVSASANTQVKAAGGVAIAVRAMRLALARVARRFFLPYQPRTS
jgi:carbon monoxide dehydrogenase subunit G